MEIVVILQMIVAIITGNYMVSEASSIESGRNIPDVSMKVEWPTPDGHINYVVFNNGELVDWGP